MWLWPECNRCAAVHRNNADISGYHYRDGVLKQNQGGTVHGRVDGGMLQWDAEPEQVPGAWPMPREWFLCRMGCCAPWEDDAELCTSAELAPTASLSVGQGML